MVGMRARIDWKLRPKKCAKRCHVVVDNDRISRLPDDILVAILSFLPLKEAARTTVLSSPWINLWKHISRLDFDAKSALVKIAIDYNLHSEESCKYVEWMNRVIQSHKAETLKEFRVCFDLTPSAENSITQWLEFALLRHVEKLDLDVSAGSLKVYNRDYAYYAFPEKFLKPASQSSSCIDFKSLKALSFKCVKLSGEAIEFFLRNCPFLEKLVLHNVNGISNLEVCGPSLALKHLKILFCAKLKSIRVSAPNLTSLNGPHVEVLLLENVPMLVELYVNCMGCLVSVQRLLSPALSSIISRLEILSLDIYAYIKEIDLPTFPELPKLKKLVIQYWARDDKSLMGLTPLIRAPPYLEEFVLKLMSSYPRKSKTPKPRRLDRKGKVKKNIKFPLKVVKFCGYYGHAGDVELVEYILENCVALEKLIIDPRSYSPLLFHRRRPEQTVQEQAARDFAKQQLEARVPQHIEFVIL